MLRVNFSCVLVGTSIVTESMSGHETSNEERSVRKQTNFVN